MKAPFVGKIDDRILESRNPGRSGVRDLNRLFLRVGDLVYDLDVDHVTINNSDAFILLSALGGIVIHRSVFGSAQEREIYVR
jgi:hypothetical protein